MEIWKLYLICLDIMFIDMTSDHNVKLDGHFKNLVGQCPIIVYNTVLCYIL